MDIKIKQRQKIFESGTIINFEIIQYKFINFRISCLYKLFWKSIYGSQNLVKLQYLNSKKKQCPQLVSIQFIYQNEAHELNFLIFISNLLCQLQCCPFIRANWYFTKTTDQFDVILSVMLNFNSKTHTMRQFLIKSSYNVHGFELIADKGWLVKI